MRPDRGRTNWLLIGLILAWSVGRGSLLEFEPSAGAAGAANLVYVAGAALSLLLHEHAQSLVARAFGRDRPGGSAGELAAALAGPLVSALAAVAVVGAARALYLAGLADPLIRALASVAALNLVLAAFNLAPALPLDGGRLLRALLRRLGRAPGQAARAAAAVTEVAALLMLAVGLSTALVGTVADALAWIILGVLLLDEGLAQRRAAAREPRRSARRPARAARPDEAPARGPPHVRPP